MEPTTFDRVVAEFHEAFGEDETVTPETPLKEYLSQYDYFPNMIVGIEREFDVETIDDKINECKTFKDLCDYLDYLLLTQKVVEILGKDTGVEGNTITLDTTLSSLGLDIENCEYLSLEFILIIELVGHIEDTFGIEISDDELEQLRTVKDICDDVQKHLAST